MKTRCVISFMVLAAFMLMSQPALADDFECIVCYSGTFSFLYKSKGMPPMFGWKHSGIAMSQSENKFLDNATMYAEGVQVGGGQKRKGFAIGKYVDLDGDMITVFGPYSGYEYELKFFMGTGKYKGIKGTPGP